MAEQGGFSPTDTIKAWKDLQENWARALKEMTSKASELATGPLTPETLKKFTDAWIDHQKEFLEKGMMLDKLFPSEELAERFNQATKMYLETYRWWADALGRNAEGFSPADMTETVTKMWKEAYEAFVAPTVNMPWMATWSKMLGVPGMPSMFPGLNLEKMTELPSKAADALVEMQRNWQEVMARATRQVVEGLEEGGPEMMKEFYASWAKGYELTVGKLLQMPPIGPAREGIELYQRSLDSYLKLCGAAFDFYLRTTKPSLEAFASVTTKAQELMKEDVTPETFQKLYGLTISEFEKRLTELFKADEFVKTLKTTLEASLTFQKDYQAFMEANLKGTPVVTRTEMNEVHEELYALRKQVKELTKAIEELRAKG